MNKEDRLQNKNKILKGLELAYEKMLLFKKQKKTELIITKNHKIVKIKLND